MRIPYSWLIELCDPGLSVEEVADVLTRGGLAVDGVERPTGGVRGVRVLEVLDMAPIEGSDKLTLVHATDGDETWEIVCGARNYAPGDRVPGALPGAVLPGGFEIGRRKIFGRTSNGMLASARELGISDDHRGIWVLERDAPLGADLGEWLDLDDPALELDLTPDRGYGLSVLGVARDLAALTGAEVRVPEVSANPGGHPSVPVVIDDAPACPRFDLREVRGVRIGAAPAWVQRRLAASGMRPINAVVDATNLAMLETGHPVHPYDRALLRGPEIRVRRAIDGEVLRTLDGVDRELVPDDLVIADAGGVIGLAGVMGGEGTEIADTTTDLVIEVASFDPVAVLRTGRRHGLRTEARTRFERGVSPETVPFGAGRVADLVVAFAGGEVVAGSDAYPAPAERSTIQLRSGRVRSLLGVDLAADAQAHHLRAVGCDVAPAAEDGGGGALLDVAPPPTRPDLRIEEDLAEEIARLHGYDRIPQRVPSTGRPGRRSPQDEARRTVRRALAGAGWTEVLTFPFTSDDAIDRLGLAADDRRRRTVRLVNPLSKEEAVLRTTLLPGLLAVLRRNVNRQNGDVAVFEVGRVFREPTPDEPGLDSGPTDVRLPAERGLLGIAACGAFDARRYDRPARSADLGDVLGAVDVVRRAVGAAALDVERVEAAPYHPGRAARVAFDGVEVGMVGELHPRVAAALEVPARTLAGELDLDRIVAGGVRAPAARTPSPLPALRFDVAVQVPRDVPAAHVERVVRAAAGDRCTGVALFDVYEGAQLGEGQRSLAFTVVLEDPEVQLTDVEEAAAIEAIAAAVEREVGGRLRR